MAGKVSAMSKNKSESTGTHKNYTVGQLADYLADKGLRVHLNGEPETLISKVNGLEESTTGDITFLANRKYIKFINQTQASAIILPETVSGPDSLAQLKVDDSYYAFCLIVELIHGQRKHPFDGISESAVISKSAIIGKNACIANGVSIADNVVIGDDAVIYPGCYIGANSNIGDGLIVYSNVSVYDNAIIGSNVTIHSGTVIGEDGFGYATHNGVHYKISQIGNVVIGDDVEIGANCAIDRSTIGSTVIGKGTKTSNSIVVGHGSSVGEHCLLVAQVGIAGSTKLGHHVVLGGQVGVNGHISIGDCVTVGAKSGVASNVKDGETLLGQPAIPIQDAKRQMLMASKLPEMRIQIKQLNKRIEQLERNLGESDLQGNSSKTNR